LGKFVESKNIAPANTSLESLAQDEKVVAAVYNELLNAGKRGGLAGMELIQGLVLVPEEWTPENVACLARDILTIESAHCSSKVKSKEYFSQVQASC
jgi:long-subunit acyl-CoA synthetase (AMP-forming)